MQLYVFGITTSILVVIPKVLVILFVTIYNVLISSEIILIKGTISLSVYLIY